MERPSTPPASLIEVDRARAQARVDEVLSLSEWEAQGPRARLVAQAHRYREPALLEDPHRGEGQGPDALHRLYDAVLAGPLRGIELIRDGASGAAVHAEVNRTLEARA